MSDENLLRTETICTSSIAMAPSPGDKEIGCDGLVHDGAPLLFVDYLVAVRFALPG